MNEPRAAAICAACGTQYPPAARPPNRCRICDDERQYVPVTGQAWTHMERLRLRHANSWRRPEPDLFSVRTEPAFGIGQRAFLVRSPGGNVLWDCVALLDDATLELVEALGGISAIAISHPHYYTTMVEWAAAFEAPIHVHADDRVWLVRHDPAVQLWEGETLRLHDGLELVRCGGHFEGGTVLHWPAGARGHGVLLSGDILQVVEDRRHVSFMRSYPNLVPLSPGAVRRIVAAIEPYAFERVYGAFTDREIVTDAKGAVRRSAARYERWIRD